MVETLAMSSIQSLLPTPSSMEEPQNWLEFPRDVTLMILMKLEAIEILETAQFVCKLWYNLCKDPSMWRSIVMLNLDEPELSEKYQNMLYSAVDRSSGGLINLNIEGFGCDELVKYIAQRSSLLKHLRLACCYKISADALIEAFEKFPLLEELELTLVSFSGEQILNIIRRCPFLKTFKLNQQGSRNPSLACDDEALAIAASMRELHHLQLIGNSMTSDGLQAILDNCPHLQSLDLRACFHVHLDGNLMKRCSEKIKELRRPNDSTDDYNYLTTDYD
uniref:F-box domain-containing protein n=2 Tax=Chenopodium quinoa TaxID=63459 RepID=A0A803MIM0_CHEQI